MTISRVLGACVAAFVLLAPRVAHASGHGPVFTLATPTNAKGGWALDIGLMGRKGREDTGAMFRAMLSYGITQDLMVSFSAPVLLETAPLAPGRLTSMMPGTGDLEGLVAWRFHRQGTDVGSRYETTVYGGIVVPGPQEPKGMLGELRKAPGAWVSLANGYASRGHYVWGGIGYQRFAESEGDQRPELLFYSAVWGYRPPAWRHEYPQWDWRVFVEMTGEKSTPIQHLGKEVSGTGGHQIFVGPTTLGIYKNYAIEGGIQFPIYRDVGPLHQKEDFRVAVNFSYFF